MNTDTLGWNLKRDGKIYRFTLIIIVISANVAHFCKPTEPKILLQREPILRISLPNSVKIIFLSNDNTVSKQIKFCSHNKDFPSVPFRLIISPVEVCKKMDCVVKVLVEGAGVVGGQHSPGPQYVSHQQGAPAHNEEHHHHKQHRHNLLAHFEHCEGY